MYFSFAMVHIFVVLVDIQFVVAMLILMSMYLVSPWCTSFWSLELMALNGMQVHIAMYSNTCQRNSKNGGSRFGA